MKRTTRTAALRRWLRDHDWTQERLAAYLGIRQGSVSHMLSGRYHIGLALGIKLADLTGIPADQLITDRKSLELAEAYAKNVGLTRGIAKDQSSVV